MVMSLACLEAPRMEGSLFKLFWGVGHDLLGFWCLPTLRGWSASKALSSSWTCDLVNPEMFLRSDSDHCGKRSCPVPAAPAAIALGHPLGIRYRARATIKTLGQPQLELAILRVGRVWRTAWCVGPIWFISSVPTSIRTPTLTKTTWREEGTRESHEFSWWLALWMFPHVGRRRLLFSPGKGSLKDVWCLF